MDQPHFTHCLSRIILGASARLFSKPTRRPGGIPISFFPRGTTQVLFVKPLMTWSQGLGKNWSGSCLSPFLSLPFLPQNHTCEWLKFVCVWGYTQLKNLFQKLNSIMFILNYIIINHTQTKYKQTIVCARALFFCHPSAHSSAMMLSFARWVSEPKQIILLFKWAQLFFLVLAYYCCLISQCIL